MTVHHIIPGRSDKNFGKAINQLIEHLPEDDWICLRDVDTLILDHRKFFLQCETLAKNNDADLIGCMTNRIGLKYQLFEGEMSDNYDILYHTEIAKNLFKEFGHTVEVVDYRVTIAGFFMLFSKKTWKQVGKFKEGGIQVHSCFIDYIFSMAVKGRGLKLGIAKGLYIFHSYRNWIHNTPNKSTRTEYKHLLK